MKLEGLYFERKLGYIFKTLSTVQFSYIYITNLRLILLNSNDHACQHLENEGRVSVASDLSD